MIQALIKGLLISTCICSSIVLMSCSEYNDNSTTIGTIIDDSVYKDEKVYKKQLADNILVDAEVNIQDKEKSILKVQKKQFKSTEIKEIIMKDLQTNETTGSMEIFGVNIPYTEFKNQSGEELIVQDGSIYYSQYEDASLNIIRGINPEVWQNNDLSFMSKTSAVEIAMNLCDKLGIVVDQTNIEILSIDYETLKGEYEKMIEEGSLKSAYLDLKISKDNEAYAINLRTLQNGIPVYSDNITLQTSDKFIEGTSLTFIINKDGLVKLTTYGSIYSLIEIEEKLTNVINIDDAIEVVKSIYNNIITEDRIIITDIELKYIPMQNSKKLSEYEFVPAYCFKVVVEGFDEKINEEYKSINYINVNAKTGKEII